MEPQTVQDPRIGMVLQDRYRIVRKLGDGGMGAVYEGEHIVIKRKVAVKILHAQFAQNPEIVARFHREAEAATSIGHPNIVEVTDMGRFPDGTAYMVLELLNGRDWSHDIDREGPQPLGKVVHIVSQVCDALAAAHAKGIVHRDLKPENIFLIERSGDPHFAKVLDFGISKMADASSENRSLTQTGTALGTPYYMAPEQCQGKKDLDARADIYALGVILFQALTGQYPFDDESYPMLVLKICTEPPPPMEQYRPDLPPEVCATVYRMLAKDRAGRFESIAEVKHALAPFRHLNEAPVVVAGPSTASRGPSVLEQRAPTPFPSTPSGTAYLPAGPGSLPGSLPQMPVASFEAQASGSRGPLLAAVAVLGLLVLVGGGFGAAVVLGLFSSDEDGGDVVARTEPEVTVDRGPDPTPMPLPAGRVDVPDGVHPTAGTEARPAGPEVPPPAGPTVRITIEVRGPPNAEVWVNNSSWGTAPVTITAAREDPPAPGMSARLHTIEARAEGWHAPPLSIPYHASETRTIVMERVRGGRGGRGADTGRVSTEAVEARPPEARPIEPRPIEPRPPEPPRPPPEPDRGLLDPFGRPVPTRRQPILGTDDVLGR